MFSMTAPRHPGWTDVRVRQGLQLDVVAREFVVATSLLPWGVSAAAFDDNMFPLKKTRDFLKLPSFGN